MKYEVFIQDGDVAFYIGDNVIELEYFNWDQHTNINDVEQQHMHQESNFLFVQLDSMPKLRIFSFDVDKEEIPYVDQQASMAYHALPCELETFTYQGGQLL